MKSGAEKVEMMGSRRCRQEACFIRRVRVGAAAEPRAGVGQRSLDRKPALRPPSPADTLSLCRCLDDVEKAVRAKPIR